MDRKEIAGTIMASLFIAGEAVDTEAFAELTGEEHGVIEEIINDLAAELTSSASGILIKRIEGKVQLCTNEIYARHINAMFAPPVSEALTNAMLETLSIIAYRQPVTRSEINDIRGVNSNYAVSALMERALVREAGRKDVLGRPVLLATTEEFLRHFGISSLEELPSIDFDAEGERQTMLEDIDGEEGNA